MPLFTSARERRLWAWVFVVVAAIWSSLGLAGTLFDTTRHHDALPYAVLGSFFVMMAALAAGALKRRPGGRELWAWVGIAAVYVMAALRMGVPVAERTHLFEYGLVAVLVHRALRARREGGVRVPVPAVLAIVIGAGLGWVDEAIQALLPNRVYDLRDVAFNALASLMAVVASEVLAWARRSVSDPA